MARETLGKEGVCNCCSLTCRNVLDWSCSDFRKFRAPLQNEQRFDLFPTATVKEAVTCNRYRELGAIRTSGLRHRQHNMGTQTVNARIEQLRQNLEWSHQVSREACRVLDQYCTQISDLERTVQPVVSKTQSLIQTRENIKQARAQAEEVLEHLDASRKVMAL